jgi:regulator of sigma E protease
MFLTIITFIIILAVLVFVHEIGHFFVARIFGVRCDEFGFGYPPRIFGIYKNHNSKWKFVWRNKDVTDAKSTVYSLNWIPLGGFVKIKGIEDFPGEKGSNNQGAGNSFAEQKAWKRACILSAGVVMNVVLAGVIISLGLMIGMPQVVDNASPLAEVKDKKVQVFEVLPNTPAQTAGLQVGDVITNIDGTEVRDVAFLQDYTDRHANQTVRYTIMRLDEKMDKYAVPVMMNDVGRSGIGVSISTVGTVKYPWYQAIWQGFKITFITFWAIVVAIFGVLKGLFMGHGAESISGPVGIAKMTGQMARMGFVYVLQFTAILSLNLAILNFLPIPALDGGRILFLIIEKIKRSPVKKQTEALIHNIGFMVLMLLIVLVTFKDINSLGCITCKLSSWWNSIVH